MMSHGFKISSNLIESRLVQFSHFKDIFSHVCKKYIYNAKTLERGKTFLNNYNAKTLERGKTFLNNRELVTK